VKATGPASPVLPIINSLELNAILPFASDNTLFLLHMTSYRLSNPALIWCSFSGGKIGVKGTGEIILLMTMQELFLRKARVALFFCRQH